MNQSNPSSREKKEIKAKLAPRSSFSPVFHFKEFRVGNLENASVINFGNNYPTNFKGYKKHNQGLGTIEGNHNDIHDLESQMNLKYMLDAIVEDEGELPEWMKEFISNYEEDEGDVQVNEDT